MKSKLHQIRKKVMLSVNNHQLITCPCCGHTIELQHQRGIHDLPGLPAGVKFDPSDQEILHHLGAKLSSDNKLLHPLIDEFIPTLDGENGICYTHPEKLPGVSKNGQVRHFFHRPSKAYTTGNRKRRKVHTDSSSDETRWHKTGKTRPVYLSGTLKGYKKILVLYTNYGRQKKPDKTNWVMHQYHLGDNEEEKDGELVLSKVFYQTHPRQCANIKELPFNQLSSNRQDHLNIKTPNFIDYYNPSPSVSYQNCDSSSHQGLIPNLVVHADPSSSILIVPSNAREK